MPHTSYSFCTLRPQPPSFDRDAHAYGKGFKEKRSFSNSSSTAFDADFFGHAADAYPLPDRMPRHLLTHTEVLFPTGSEPWTGGGYDAFHVDPACAVFPDGPSPAESSSPSRDTGSSFPIVHPWMCSNATANRQRRSRGLPDSREAFLARSSVQTYAPDAASLQPQTSRFGVPTHPHPWTLPTAYSGACALPSDTRPDETLAEETFALPPSGSGLRSSFRAASLPPLPTTLDAVSPRRHRGSEAACADARRAARHSSGCPRRCRGDCSCAQSDSRKRCSTVVASGGRAGCLHAHGMKKTQQQPKRRRRREAAAERERHLLQGHGEEPRRRSAAWRTTGNSGDALSPASTRSSNSDLANRQRETEHHTGREGVTFFERKKREGSSENSDPRTNTDARGGHTRKGADRNRREGERRATDRRQSPRRSSSSTAMLRQPPGSDLATQGTLRWGTSRHPQKQKDPPFHAHRLSEGRRREFQVDPFESPREDVEESENAVSSWLCSPRDAGEAARPLSRQRLRVDAKSARTKADRDLNESTHLNERRRVGELKRPSRLSASEEETADPSASSDDSRFGVPNPQTAHNEVWPSSTRREETPSLWTPSVVPGGQQLLWQQTTRRLTVEEEQAVACLSGNCDERRGRVFTDESPELGCLVTAPDAVCPQCHAVQDLQRTGSFPAAPHMSAGPSLLFEDSERRPTTSFVPEAGARDPDPRRSNVLSSDGKRLPPLARGCCVTPDAQAPGDLVHLLMEKERCMRGLERQLSALQVEHRTLLALADGSSLPSACLRVPEENNEGWGEDGSFLNARSSSGPREQPPPASFTAVTSFRGIRGTKRKVAPVHCPYSDEKVFPGVHVSSHTPSSTFAFPEVEKPFQKPFFFPPLDAEEEKRVRGEAARAALGFPSFSPYQRVYGSVEVDQRKGCAQSFEQKKCFREEKHRGLTGHLPPGHIQERNLSHRAAHPARFQRVATAPAALGEAFPTHLSPVSESDGEESRDGLAYPADPRRRRCRTHAFAEGSLHARHIADAGNPNGGEALYEQDLRSGYARLSSASKRRDKCSIPYMDASRPDATFQGPGRERSRKEETEGLEGRWQREKEERYAQKARGGLEAWERHPEKKTTNSNVSGSAAVDSHSRESREEQRRHPVARAAVEVLRKAKERRGVAARTTVSSQLEREKDLERESDRDFMSDGRGDGEDVERRTEKESRKGNGREQRQKRFSVEVRESPQMHRRRASLAGEEWREAGDIGEESEAGPHAELEVEADVVEKKSEKTRRTRHRPVKKKAEPALVRKKTQADLEEDEGEAPRAALSRRTRTKVEEDGEETRGKAKEKMSGNARGRGDNTGSVASEGAPQPRGPLRRSPRLEGQEQRRQEREAEQEYVETHATKTEGQAPETEGQATDILGCGDSPEDALDDLFSFDSPSPECAPAVSSSLPAGSGRRKASQTEKNKKRREVAASTESPRGRRSGRESRKTRERENLLLSLSPATQAPASVSRREADAASVAPARFPLSSADSVGVAERSRVFSSLEDAASSPSAAREQGGEQGEEKERSSTTTANATKLSPLQPSEKPRSERTLKDSKDNDSASAGRPRQKRSRTTSVLRREEKRPTLVHDAKTLQRLRREELETIPSPIVTRIRLGLFDRLSLMKKTNAGDKESDRKPAARAGASEGSGNQLDDSQERTPRRHSTQKTTQAEPGAEAFRGQRRRGDKEGRKEEGAEGSKPGDNEGGTRVPLASTAARNEKAEARGVEDEEGGGEEESAQPGEAFAGGSVKRRGASGSSRERNESSETVATTPSWRAVEDGVQAGDRLGGRVVRRGTDVRNRAFSSTLLRLINGDMRVTTEKDVHLFITNYCLEKGLRQLRSVANGKKVKKWPIGKDPLLRVLFGEAANTFPASKAEMMETLRKNKHISYFSIA
ncbi:hypothetical protein TGMAS_205640 [Toxoplasma gondii MAS]|uniref:Uncharacterized protein n=2 Tax=Toxoplasma gondii TaxID=5811 RepID=A0A086Q4V4_TOXGO|nr:hypothetical protein TGMAS_205640 [Toxoplasma gondii MAS]PUA85650.1 hypothetical protein TGBR9_205640 [Toxoplasma gondii TgCATBr9]